MTRKEAIKIMEHLKSIVSSEDYKEAFSMAIEALEKQIPKKPYNDNENGVYEKEYCPTCHRSLFPNEHHCKCGQAITWENENDRMRKDI